MKLSLLEIVQDILNDMDGDNVNSINDTIESQQVAQIVKTTYLEMMANRNWPHMHTAFNCTSYVSTSYPTSLVLPETIKELKWIKYNKRTATDTKDKWEDLTYLEPEDFFHVCSARDSSASNMQIVLLNGMNLNIRNDIAPTYWTTFDDSTLILDSWNSAVDSVLQTGKNNCWGVKNPQWSALDAAIPELPSEAFPALLEESKSTAFYVLRQAANEKAEQKATRQNRWLSRKAWRAKGGVRYPNYGRRKAFSGYEKNPLLDKG
jgi:hypothetical protein